MATLVALLGMAPCALRAAETPNATTGIDAASLITATPTASIDPKPAPSPAATDGAPSPSLPDQLPELSEAPDPKGMDDVKNADRSSWFVLPPPPVDEFQLQDLPVRGLVGQVLRTPKDHRLLHLINPFAPEKYFPESKPARPPTPYDFDYNVFGDLAYWP